ncbi:minor capsid protein [Sinomicrobium kalidii]|uniref:phage head morphogenesis protein n=1 Tax=Sinomicrobium kalidii TaxID=2900738 RepID=UPI001E45397B|nr:phage minor head protein [Sinomicrobium kalidii]UGU15203.1 minor capsid protein [Sinomicrobium kalidii]
MGGTANRGADPGIKTNHRFKRYERSNSQVFKKKVLPALNSIHRFYAGYVPGKPVALDVSRYGKIIDRLAEAILSGELQPEALDPELIDTIFDDIREQAQKGWGKDWTKWGEKAQADTVKMKMEENLYKFSGAKSYTQLVEINQLAQKYKNDYQGFKDQVQVLNGQYNKNYLQAEFQTARQAGHHAGQWQTFEADKDLFPNLKYRTVGDDRVREEHTVLEGTVKPLDDPFWSLYYPPNGWRCRCTAIQTAEKPTGKGNIPEDMVKPEFRTNVGKTGEVFKADQGYFRIVHKTVSDRIENLFIERTSNEAREYAKTRYVEKQVKFSHPELPASFTLSNKDIKAIVSTPHKDQVGRNYLVRNLKNDLREAEFMLSTEVGKEKALYKRWFYLKSRSGDYYYNIAELANGRLALRAITDTIKEKKQ